MTSHVPFKLILRHARAAVLLLLTVVAIAVSVQAASAQHEPAPQATPAGAAAHDAAAQAHEEEHEGGWLSLIAKIFNFAVLAAVLVYFLRAPLNGYLSSRITRVREDLVNAAAMREAAMRQLGEIEAKLKALPGELEALKQRGAADIAAERVRIEQAAETERQRLLEHTRREIDMRLRIARRELVEFGASLAVAVASERIKRSITTADQARLLDRYTAQLTGARQ